MGWNSFLHVLARFLPGGKNLRPFLHRLRGVHIEGKVFIGDDVYIDEDCPGAVELHDGVVIAPRCSIIAHTRGAGRVIIRERSALGAGCMIVCAKGQTLTIGEGAVISAGSTVSHDIQPYTLCGAPRIQAFGKITVPFSIDVEYKEFIAGVKPMPRPQEEKKSAVLSVSEDK